MKRLKKAVAEKQARDFVATFADKQACWEYLKSLGIEWKESDDAAVNDERAMNALIGEYLEGLDPSKAKTHGYISKARMDRFTWHEGDLKFISREEFDKMVRDGKVIF